MRAVALGLAFVCGGLLFVACSGQSATIGDADAGDTGDARADRSNPPGCPAAEPQGGAACAVEGLSCAYACPVTARCTSGAWVIETSAISCPADAGPSDGSRRLADGAIACSSDPDCRIPGEVVTTCSPGGRITGCGICFRPPNPCNTDGECLLVDGSAPPKPLVCEPAGSCVCPTGKTGTCVAACQSAADCGPNLACSGGHCVAKPCATDGDCSNTSLGDFACTAARTCAPKACATDGDCGGHYCVDKFCYPQPGICVPPAA
jgi:hypothetical protein